MEVISDALELRTYIHAAVSFSIEREDFARLKIPFASFIRRWICYLLTIRNLVVRKQTSSVSRFATVGSYITASHLKSSSEP